MLRLKTLQACLGLYLRQISAKMTVVESEYYGIAWEIGLISYHLCALSERVCRNNPNQDLG